MSLEFKGILIVKEDEQQISDNFKKREFVLEHTKIVGQKEFTDMVKFQLTQDRCKLIDLVSIGSEVKVHFNLRGRKWEKDGNVNYFTNLEAWKIESANTRAGIDIPPIEDNGNDLPF